MRRLVRALLVEWARVGQELWEQVQPQLSPSTEADIDDGWDTVKCCDHDCTVDIDSPVPLIPADAMQRLDEMLWELELGDAS